MPLPQRKTKLEVCGVTIYYLMNMKKKARKIFVVDT
jgi:hypothetical protein